MVVAFLGRCFGLDFIGERGTLSFYPSGGPFTRFAEFVADPRGSNAMRIRVAQSNANAAAVTSAPWTQKRKL